MSETEDPHHYHQGKRKERYNFHESLSEGEIALLKGKLPLVDRMLAEFSEPRSPYLWMKPENETDVFVLWTWGETAKPFFRLTRDELDSLG